MSPSELPDATWVEGGQEVLFTCLHCGRKKAYYNPAKGVGLCFRCEQVYTRKDFSDALTIPSFNSGKRLTTGRSTSSTVSSPWLLRGRHYLAGRGVDLDEFPTIQITSEGISFPVYSTASGAEGRMLKTWGGRWLSRTLARQECIFCLSPLPDFYQDQEMVLVEGIFDVLTPRLRYGVALLGSRLGASQEAWIRMARPLKVWVWMDPDTAGRKASEDICHRLQDLKAEPVLADKEPGDLTPADIPLSWRF